VRFAPDGRVFVAQKEGWVIAFNSLSSPTPTLVVDLSTSVDDYWDRGLLGLAVDPAFPTRPYIYLLYSLDAPPGGTIPTWNDACPTPPGALTDGCVVTGRLSRIQVDVNNHMVGTEQVLIDARWCQQFPSHSIGNLEFGPDGALYVSGGEGASFGGVDYGQFGGSLSGTPTPANPCGDPPAGIGGTMAPPTARGGALRAQRLISPYPMDPPALNGAILRVDPNTGAALPTNPLYGTGRGEMERIVAMGLRNPFRFTFRPGTRELWIGNVGWDTWESIYLLVDPLGSTINDFGWPCYEGSAIQGAYQSAGLELCTNLYNRTSLPPFIALTLPYYSYNHSNLVVAGETCPSGSSSVTGVAFYTGGSYPAQYNGALFFADYSRNCIWAMLPGSSGLPDPSRIVTFAAGSQEPVQLIIGPAGDLFYVDLAIENSSAGSIHRIQYSQSSPPNAVITEDVTSGPAPLTVHLSAASSSDPNPGGSLTYAWDLYGSGQFTDSTAVNVIATFGPGSHLVQLRVTDTAGLTATAQVSIVANYTPPVATILTPSPDLTWFVGQPITFSGQGTDAVDGQLPASAFAWHLLLHHCPSNCHLHAIQDFAGVTSGSFSAPDHGYPSWMELQLVVTDSGGLSTTTSVLLYPQTTSLTVASSPSALPISLGSVTAATPFSETVITGSANTLGAPSWQTDAGGARWAFNNWSDGGEASHTVTAPAAPTTFTASYTRYQGCGLLGIEGLAVLLPLWAIRSVKRRQRAGRAA